MRVPSAHLRHITCCPRLWPSVELRHGERRLHRCPVSLTGKAAAHWDQAPRCWHARFCHRPAGTPAPLCTPPGMLVVQPLLVLYASAPRVSSQGMPVPKSTCSPSCPDVPYVPERPQRWDVATALYYGAVSAWILYVLSVTSRYSAVIIATWEAKNSGSRDRHNLRSREQWQP